jgi:hypothetical protein
MLHNYLLRAHELRVERTASNPTDRWAVATVNRDQAERLTAHKYSNAIDWERLRQDAAGHIPGPNDHERPRRREFASRGSWR